ncbi:MAG: glycosyltransferase family 2 protein [Methylobacterium sp.]|uniref:glycosyltransferase family A protein n=1 Tax=Methylobacterium sp. TaxID=409 RepID=UPI0025E972B2|nr:glycosyltransferase family A protein [Methylobacterium sp.]MBX9933756.1 glycosyltransferase family 2 protein [Methylobacterium sp.]
MIDISFIVNLHAEGRICLPTLDTALTAVKYANKHGVVSELILVLDNPDNGTLRLVKNLDFKCRIEITDVRDLGLARNFGVEAAGGKYIAFLDGDDLCCDDWLLKAYEEAVNHDTDCIVHPKFNLFFGRDYDQYFWVHPDCRYDGVKLSRLLVENLWTSSVFAERKIFEKIPYWRNDLKNGIGYEDWVFNIETAVSNVRHIVAPDTIIFIRRNKTSSLLDNSNSVGVVPDILRIFSKMNSKMNVNRII